MNSENGSLDGVLDTSFMEDFVPGVTVLTQVQIESLKRLRNCYNGSAAMYLGAPDASLHAQALLEFRSDIEEFDPSDGFGLLGFVEDAYAQYSSKPEVAKDALEKLGEYFTRANKLFILD